MLILHFGVCTVMCVVVVLTCVAACSHEDTSKHHKCAHSRCPTCLVNCHFARNVVHSVLPCLCTCNQHESLLQATHIFDGLESWPSHLMYLAGGTMHLFKPASEIPELQEGRLLQLVERCVCPYVLQLTADAHDSMCCLCVAFVKVLDTLFISTKDLLFDI